VLRAGDRGDSSLLDDRLQLGVDVGDEVAAGTESVS
jgi:hypothetical protein